MLPCMNATVFTCVSADLCAGVPLEKKKGKLDLMVSQVFLSDSNEIKWRAF